MTGLDQEVALTGLRTFDDMLASATAGPQFQTLLLGSFTGIALLLTAAGLYGALGYSVARRTRELGIRVVLGATRAMVVGMILRRAAVLVAVGLSLGTLSALAGNRLFLSMVADSKPATFPLLVVASLVVTFTAVAAAYLPARRAASIDPTVALRIE